MNDSLCGAEIIMICNLKVLARFSEDVMTLDLEFILLGLSNNCLHAPLKFDFLPNKSMQKLITLSVYT